MTRSLIRHEYAIAGEKISLSFPSSRCEQSDGNLVSLVYYFMRESLLSKMFVKFFVSRGNLRGIFCRYSRRIEVRSPSTKYIEQVLIASIG